MKASKTFLLAAMGVSLTLSTGGGRVGCGAGIETDPAGTSPALQIQPVVETITLDGENFYAVCANHSCDDVEWSLTDPETGESVAALDVSTKKRARFNRRPGEKNGGKVVPDPAIPDETKLNVKACTSDGTACDEIQVTVLKTENDSLKESRVIDDTCQYDSVGAMDTRTTGINVSSVLVTASNRECFDNPVGSLHISINGKNFTPTSADYVLSPFKVEVLGLELPRGDGGGCPDFQNGTPVFIGLDGTRYDALVDDGGGGNRINPVVVRELDDIRVDIMDIALGWINQLCGDFTAEDFEGNKDSGGFWGAVGRSLSRLTLREIIDCAQGVVITAENMVEWIPSLFSSGMVFDQGGTPWNMEELYQCIFEGDAFGQKGADTFHISRLKVTYAGIEWNGGGQSSPLSQDGSRPTIINDSSATIRVQFDRPLNTQTVNTGTVYVCQGGIGNNCVPFNTQDFSFTNDWKEFSLPLSNLQFGAYYELWLRGGDSGLRSSDSGDVKLSDDTFSGSFRVQIN